MNLPVPNLDTIDFERLVEDARGLIPLHAPGWTDHNVHDPGITLIELLAWVTDQEIYRVGFVGKSYREAFAALLGARLLRAKPASGLVWPSDPPVGPVALKAGQRIGSIEQPDTAFLVPYEVFISDAACDKVVAASGSRRQRVDYLLGELGNYTPRLTGEDAVQHIALTFDRPLVPPLPEATHAIVSLGIDGDPFPGIDGDAPQSFGPIAFDYSIDDEDPRPVTITEDGTLALARTGVVLLRIPTARPGAAGKSSTLRLRFDRGFFPIAPCIRQFAINVLKIVQLESMPEDVLARGTGLPDQTVDFDLSRLPVSALGTVPFRIEVDRDEWTIVPDFEDSGPNDPHVVADLAHGRLTFGNGINGLIPPRDSQIRYPEFHATDGERGNLGARLSWQLVGVAGIAGRNPKPLAGGANGWSVDHELRAEMRRRATIRAVLLTDAELKSAAESLPGFSVARAEVIKRHVPSLPSLSIKGSRTLVVVPARDPRTPPAGRVPRAYLEALAAKLAPRRLLGERFSVVGPTYVTIDLALRLLVAAGEDAEAARWSVEDRIRARLNDLERGPETPPWPLGRSVTCGEVKTLIAGIREVDAVLECRIGVRGAPLGETDIPLRPTEIAIAGTVDIVIASDYARGGRQ